MTPAAWGVLMGTWIAAVASPGPDFAAVLAATLKGGRKNGLAVAAGIAVGIGLWVIAALVGVIAIVSSQPVVFTVVKVCGALFLLGYGARILWGSIRALREARRLHAESADVGAGGKDSAGAEVSPASSAEPGFSAEDAAGGAGTESAAPVRVSAARSGELARSFRLGVLTNTVGNPKAVIFFGALFATILPPQISVGESIAVGAAMTGWAFVWFALLAFIVSIPVFVKVYERSARVVDIALAVVFLALGTVILVTL